MCGINGYYLKNSKDVFITDLEGANNKLKHRGPDNEGVYFNKEELIGLGHTRLSIQDVTQNANQPMVSNCKNVVITFNGEIYNFKELKSFLLNNSEEFVFKSSSDTEVVLNLFLYCDQENKSISYFLSKLKGIFSLAIWNNDSQELLIARDSYGVKPLYFSDNDNGFFFSSEIKAMPKLGVKIKDIDFVALNYYLTFIWCPGERTPSKNIKKVQPGEALLIKNGDIKKKFTWYKHPYLTTRKIIKNKFECLKGTEFLLRQAVQRQLISDVPVGAFLSGGLDSSSIVAFAKEQIPNINCFTIYTKESMKDDGFVDDYQYATKVSKHLNVPLNTVEVDENILINSLEDMVYQLDEPIADPASINVLLISRLANEMGIKVLLSGTGGDDLFSGYRRHRALLGESYWSYLPLNLRKRLSLFTSKLNTNNIFYRRIKKGFNGAELNSEERIINYYKWNSKSLLTALYTQDFLNVLQKYKYEDPLLCYLKNLPNELPKLDKMLSLEQRFFLSDHNFIYTDKMSMQEGVEVRVPFLDHELVEFASNIPVKFKNRRGELKWILKKSMEKYLPKEIIYRPKTGFGVPIRKWVKKELKEWIYETLSLEALKSRGFFKAEAVHQLIKDNLDNRVDAGYTILSMACIEIWCQRFIDKY